MAGEEASNAEELRANLAEYEGQLHQVEQLLLDDPSNEEYRDIYDSLAEVIVLTKDLLAEAGPKEQAPSAAPTPAGPSGPRAAAGQALPVAAITAAPDLRIPSVLPPQVAQQIRHAQQRAALSGQAPPAWAIGAPCQAVYSADGQWYNAKVEAVSVSGNFIVVYEGYDAREECERASVRARPEEEEEAYKGVAAPKQRKVEELDVVDEMPKWLEIKPTDDDKTKSKKKKLQKSYKSKLRFQKMDSQQKNKAEAWRSFVSGKGSKKKAGFLTGTKKESIFRVPEGYKGKVGVVGSGQGMTDYQKRKRHEFDTLAGGDGL